MRSQATIPNTNGTVVASYPSIPYVGQYAGEDYSVFCEYSSLSPIAHALTYRPFSLTDTALRRNRDIALDAATQYYTLHLYATNQAKPSPSKPRRPNTATACPATPRVDADEDDELEMRGFQGGMRARRMAREDTSMKKIKNVQGIEGSWTVTDCDADRKGER